MKVIDLLEAADPFERMVVKSYKWAEGNYKTFSGAMMAHMNFYHGRPEDDSEGDWEFGDWEDDVKHIFENGGRIERVMFLDKLQDMRINELGGHSSWTTMELEGNELVSYLRDNNDGTGGSGETAFILVANTPSKNINLGVVNLPEEYREKEVNVTDMGKLTDITIHKQIDYQTLELVGTLDYQAKKIKLVTK